MDRAIAVSRDPCPPGADGLLPVLGAVLAGGASSRFGSPKALATVGGKPLVVRVAESLSHVASRTVVITHLAEVSTLVALPSRPDSTERAGPLAGVEAALAWADEMGLAGALCVACDLPFVPATLLRELAARGLETGAPAMVPEGPDSGVLQPLCAWYSTRALPAVRGAVRGEDRSLASLLGELVAPRLPLARVTTHGDPAIIFLNVNTPSTHRAAEALAAERHG